MSDKPDRVYTLRDYTSHSHSGGGLFGDVFSDRLEQTVGGAILGTGRDLGGGRRSFAEKLERAKENDFACTVAADTVVVIPKLKGLPAGLVRASMLANPHQGLQENFSPFVKNAAEGYALNTVGSQMLPGSTVQKALSTRIKSGLGREVVTHLGVGGGFGFVKAGFDERTYVDENGQFSPGGAGVNLLKSTVTGMGVNLPAGMIGMRVTRSSMGLMAQREISGGLATTIASASGGYASGAMFGGIEAIAEGKGLSFATLEQMHFGGKVGAATGALVGVTDRGHLNKRYQSLSEAFMANSLPIQEKPTVVAKRKMPNPNPDRISVELDGITPKERVSSDPAPEALDFKLRSYKVAEISPRVKATNETETHSINCLKSDAVNEQGQPKKRFASYEDFLAHTEVKSVKLKVFEVEGHKTKFMVEESLALEMQATGVKKAAYQKAAAKSVPFDALAPEIQERINLEFGDSKNRMNLLTRFLGEEGARKSIDTVTARHELAHGEISRMPTMEDFVVLLDETPNRDLVKRLVLLHRADPENPYSRQVFNMPKFNAGAEAQRDGTIIYYMEPGKAHPIEHLRQYMNHEFSHLIAYDNPNVMTRLYTLAAIVDKDVPNPNYNPNAGKNGQPVDPDSVSKMKKFYASEYASKTIDEDGAVHLGEEMMAVDGYRLQDLSRVAPVRTMVAGEGLGQTMAQARPRQRSTNHPELQRRLDVVNEEASPDAIALLEKRLKTGSNVEKAAAAELLGNFGNAERHVPMLRKLASEPGSRVVPDLDFVANQPYAGPDGVRNGGKEGLRFRVTDEPRTLAEIAFDNMLRLHEGNPFDQLSLLGTEAKFNSATGQIARTRLQTTTDPFAPHFLRLAQISGDANKLPQILEMMYSMPSDTGKRMAFDAALNLGGHSPDFRASVIGKGLDMPELRLHALNSVKPADVATLRPRLEAIGRVQNDAVSRDAALELLGKTSKEVGVASLVDMLHSKEPAKVAQALEGIAGGKAADTKLVEPLIEVALTGPEASRQPAMDALSRYSPQLIKFYATNVGRRGISVPPAFLASFRR